MLTPFAIAAALLAQPPAPSGAPGDATPLPTLTLRADDTTIDHSCRIEIPPGTVIPDPNNNGVIQIAADGITIEFAEGSTLRGSPPNTAPDAMTGLGIRLDGHKNVTLRNLSVGGYKVGLLATKSPGLTIEASRFDDLFRQHLRSTPQAEDASDWLWPHKNDQHEWRTNYGAAVCIEDSAGVTIRNVTVRRAQNGVIMDRVTGSRFFDNDCSFLSGWGLAMWRSSGNLVSRNALDFCVRGYSHGVYNRGQDSAGLLMFEQCSGNVIVENSVTRGGDGLFGFAGHEAIGETPAPTPGFNYTRRGCNDNLIARNDFSYAPAHGLEMTFSHGNRIVANRFTQNAICGIWGGYSQGMLIAENTFEGNGEAAYGLERGGINIEHGSDHTIVANAFTGDKCGVHLWWGESELLKKPGVAPNEKGVRDNLIAGNTFNRVATVLHLRDLSPAKDKVTGTVFTSNKVEDCDKPTDVTPGVSVTTAGEEPMYVLPDAHPLGDHKPLGARAALGGREGIIMTEWGPWDHASPLVRRAASIAQGDVYVVLGAKAVDVQSLQPGATVLRLSPNAGESARFAIPGTPNSLTPYSLTVVADGQSFPVDGVAIRATWDVRVFPWPAGADPREKLQEWRTGADSPAATKVSWEGPLVLTLGQRGPRSIPAWNAQAAALPAGDRYGVIATTELTVPRGRWRLITRSDDGVRATLIRRAEGAVPSGETLINNWTWHGPTRDAAEFDQIADGPIGIQVEYFQIDGFAVLEVALEPVK